MTQTSEETQADTMPRMTADDLAAFVWESSRMWSMSARIAFRHGDVPVTEKTITRERARRSKVMREVFAPGHPAGPELQSQCLTACMDGWRALAAWRAGVRPAGMPSA